MNDYDTIAAISTTLGESGIAIIRISGNNARNVIKNIFRDKKGNRINEFNHYTFKHGYIHEIETNDALDEVLVSFMKSPNSFTGEDTIEINCHGGFLAVQKTLEEVIKSGARIAEPGEFTKRAFLNGRIDLSQAEAVIDIINSKTVNSIKSSINQSKGNLSIIVNELRDNILNLIANIAAVVDYPEEDMEDVTAMNSIDKIMDIFNRINKLIISYEDGKIIKDGIKAVIVGKPNVGKSSLLNNILKENRAIVTDVPGTTRDIIEEYVNIGGILLKIIDTAGIRKTEDLVEKIGVEKTKEKVKEADLVIFMVDASRELDNEDEEILSYLQDGEKKYIVLLNKSDLPNKIDNFELKGVNKENIINISAKSGLGVDLINDKIKDLFFKGDVSSSNYVINNLRHKESLLKTKEALEAALESLKNVGDIDLASIDLKNAYFRLGEITGDTLEDDIIDKIFSKFCLGK
ncbi:MAG: tRNA uridine-5-carboxymethylaminomethyl(34) synthesis GTPase MnmE [Clostridiaceae bacterium]